MSNRPKHFSLWARNAIGVDADQDGLTLVRATVRGRRLSFETILKVPDRISRNETVAACLFQRESFIKWLTVPLSSVRKAERVFPSLLDVQLPFSTENCEYALVMTRPTADRSGTRGLLAGARHEDIEKRLAELQAGGVNPHVLDQESLALWSQGLREWPDEQAVRILVYLGGNRTTLVMGQHDELLCAHCLRQPDPDQIIRLLKSTFPTPPAASQWIWTGPLAADPDVVRKHQAVLAPRWPGSMEVARDPKTFLARALAARALSPPANRCNLGTGRFTHPLLVTRQNRAPFRAVSALLAAGLLLMAINLAWQAAMGRRMAFAQDQIRRLAIEVTGSPRLVPRGQELLASRRALESQSRQMEPFLESATMPLSESLKQVLAICGEEGLAVETLSITRQVVVIHGLAPKWTHCEKAVSRLKQLGNNVKVERKDTPTGEVRQAFVISMGWPHER